MIKLENPSTYKADLFEMLKKCKSKSAQSRLLNAEQNDIEYIIESIEPQFKNKSIAWHLGETYTENDADTLHLYVYAIEQLRAKLNSK